MSTPPPPLPVDPIRDIEREIDVLTSNALPELHWWSSAEHWSALFLDVEHLVDQFLDSAIGNLTEEERNEIVKEVKYRREKLPLKTGITDQILGICQQIP